MSPSTSSPPAASTRSASTTSPQAAGIARRTLFRYYPSKNALPWGDFDAHLERMRDQLAELDPGVPDR